MEAELCRSQGRGGVLPTALAEAIGEERAAVPYPSEGGTRTEDSSWLPFPKVNFQVLNMTLQHTRAHHPVRGGVYKER